MNGKLVKLGVAAGIALILAFWIGNMRTPATGTGDTLELAPRLKDGINDVATVRVIAAESRPLFTLSRGPDGWMVKERSGYPADFAKIREFLLKLADSKLVEPKTSVPASYAKLGVEDVAAKGAKGLLLEVEGKSLKAPVRVIVGNFNGRGGDGTFVRRAGEPQSWLASGNLTVDRDPANWLQRDLADIPSTRIEEVTVTTAGRTLRVYKKDAADTNYLVADLPKGREPSSEFVANALASVLAGLRFDDVLKDDGSAPPDKHFELRYATYEGVVVTARAWEVGDKAHARFAATLDEERAEAAIAASQARAKSDYDAAVAAASASESRKDAASAKADAGTPAQTPPAATEKPSPPAAVADPAKDREERLAALRKEVATLQERFEGWTFVLPNYKFANMNKTMDDMLKPLDATK